VEGAAPLMPRLTIIALVLCACAAVNFLISHNWFAAAWACIAAIWVINHALVVKS
jgi:hypothetical protein